MTGPHSAITVRADAAVAEITLGPAPPSGDRAPDAAAAVREACAEVGVSAGVRAVILWLPRAGASPTPGAAEAVAGIPHPVVAALRGRVADGALEAALAADIRVCARGATFALAEVTRGGLPSDGGTQRLPRLVGPGLAADMLLTGRELTAEEALSAGLVTEVVSDDALDARARDIARGIAGRGALAGRYTKEAVRRGADMPLTDAMRLEADLSILLHTDPERAEGIEAFKEGRPPRLPPAGR